MMVEVMSGHVLGRWTTEEVIVMISFVRFAFKDTPFVI